MREQMPAWDPFNETPSKELQATKLGESGKERGK